MPKNRQSQLGVWTLVKGDALKMKSYKLVPTMPQQSFKVVEHLRNHRQTNSSYFRPEQGPSRTGWLLIEELQDYSRGGSLLAAFAVDSCRECSVTHHQGAFEGENLVDSKQLIRLTVAIAAVVIADSHGSLLGCCLDLLKRQGVTAASSCLAYL